MRLGKSVLRRDAGQPLVCWRRSLFDILRVIFPASVLSRHSVERWRSARVVLSETQILHGEFQMRTMLTCTVALMTFSALHDATAQQSLSPGPAPIEQRGVDPALGSESGKAGTQEPSAASPAVETQDKAVFVNGALNVPGAPKDSQTVPA